MFGIQLTLLQKLEVAFICVVLSIAGLLVWWNTGPRFDMTVTSFSLPIRHHPVNDNANHSALVNATNPADPKRDELVTVFACSDGQLEITQYPNDSDHHPLLTWKPETRQPGKIYQYYQAPMAPVDQIKDPFRHALAYATYNTIYGRALGLLGHVDLTAAQIQQEGDARNLMLNEIKLINNGIDAGTYYPKLMDEVMKALAAYDAKAGDPTKDDAKAKLAHKVLGAVKDFFSQEEADKSKAIDKYMSVLDKTLNADQKQKLIDAYKTLTSAPTAGGARRAPAPPVAAPARGARGNPATRGGRGAAVPAGG